MPGRIVSEDLARVRELTRIEDVVGGYMTLRRNGADLTGLCPFHDEKTPSFHVSPGPGLFYCFGCGVGGDVIQFVQRIDNLSFMEAVQSLADRVGVTLRFETPTRQTGDSVSPGLRQRILAANQAAAEFYGKQLLSPEGVVARQMLDERGFDRAIAEQFGVGYAPKHGQALRDHLRSKGFSGDELVKANLIRQSGEADVFRGRVVWPIRDSTTTVLGFGARRLYDDDKIKGKYINTAETIVYKKSRVLYGLDLARGPIGRLGQAVVMEGYTDVMAAHLSGIDTAVASCGTAFGEEHARLLQRLIGLPEQGRVVFTFDGDAAGQNAALKVFDLNDRFAVPTYVAVAPDGLDPCDLRLQRGEVAVRDLVSNPQPLYEFVMRHKMSGFDLDRADSRVDAVRAAAEVVAKVQDAQKRSAFIEEIAGLVGMDVGRARQIISATNKRRPKPPQPSQPSRPKVDVHPIEEAPTSGDVPLPRESPSEAVAAQQMPYPSAREASLAAERGLCQLMLQYPTYFTTDWCGVDPADLRHPAYQAICQAVIDTPFEYEGWAQKVQDATPNPVVRRLETELLVAPLLREPDEAYVSAYAARVRLGRLTAQLEVLRSRLQRQNPITDAETQVPLFERVVQLEAVKARLTREAFGVAG